MALKNTEISKLKPKEKSYLLSDFNGLFIEVRPNGDKVFKLIFKHEKRQFKKVVGKFGEMDLNQARLKSANLRNEIISTQPTKSKTITAEKIANEWLKIKEKAVKFEVLQDIVSIINRSFIKPFAKREIGAIKRAEIINAINATFGEKTESKYRAFSNIRQILNFAVINEFIEYNPLLGINPSDIFGKRQVRNFATITDGAKLGELLEKIINSRANFSVKSALIFTALSALRVSNAVNLKWRNVDFESGILKFSSDEMKISRDFYLPMSSQVREILAFIYKNHRLKNCEFVFFNEKTIKPINANSLLVQIRRIGYKKGEFTTHGFRSAFSTICNDNGLNSDIIEMCLAHTLKGVRGVYDRSHKLTQKRELMQWWADYLSAKFEFKKLFGFANL